MKIFGPAKWLPGDPSATGREGKQATEKVGYESSMGLDYQEPTPRVVVEEDGRVLLFVRESNPAIRDPRGYRVEISPADLLLIEAAVEAAADRRECHHVPVGSLGFWCTLDHGHGGDHYHDPSDRRWKDDA